MLWTLITIVADGKKETKWDLEKEHDAEVRNKAIDECIKLIAGAIKSIVGIYNKDTPLTDRASYRVAKNELIKELLEQLEQLKQQN